MLTVYEIYTKEKDGKQFLWGYVETLAEAVKAIQRLNYTAYLQDTGFSYEYFEVPDSANNTTTVIGSYPLGISKARIIKQAAKFLHDVVIVY